MSELLHMLSASLPQPFDVGRFNTAQRIYYDEDDDSSSDSSSDCASESLEEDAAAAAATDQRPRAQPECFRAAGGASASNRKASGALHNGPEVIRTAINGPAAERCAETDYDGFLAYYWPHFDQRLTVNLDPSLVFAEIQACIKGAEGSLTSRRGRLSRSAYVQLAEARASSLSEEQRTAVYRLFRRFEGLKATRCEYDMMDLTHYIWQQILLHGFQNRMEAVYVDEAQDLVLAQLALLALLCKDITQGLVFAGDTAQTITKGVSFRFADISAMLYRLHYNLLADNHGIHDPVTASDGGSMQPLDTATGCGNGTHQSSSSSYSCSSCSYSSKATNGAPAVGSGGCFELNAMQQGQPLGKRLKQPKRAAKSLAACRHRGSQSPAIRATKSASESASTSSSSADSTTALLQGSHSEVMASDSQKQQPKQQQSRQGRAASTGKRLSVSASAVAADVQYATAGKQAVAQLQTLRQNWRAQHHVLAVANAITDVIYHFFPNTIDKLPSETSSVGGELPVLLEPGPANDPLQALFGSRVSSDGLISGASTGASYRQPSPAKLSADTAVLVRDDAAAAAVRRLVMDAALVLTVAEAKGLEFENVLVYNLFSSSGAASKRTRLLYSYLTSQGCLNSKQLHQPQYKGPIFDPSKHYEFAADLKFWYVAVTRARSRLLVYEHNEETSGALKDFLMLCRHTSTSGSGPCRSAPGLISLQSLDVEQLSILQQESTIEQWAQLARDLLSDCKYERAETCFRRAGDNHNALLCKAEQHMLLARQTSGDTRKQHLREAGSQYQEIERWQQAGNCLRDAGLFEEAADIFRHTLDPPMLEEAAVCYRNGRCWRKAAETYVAMGQLPAVYSALDCCLAGRLWSYCLTLLDKYQSHMNEQSVLQYLEKCGRGLFKEKDYQLAETCFSRAGDETNALLCKAEQQVVLSCRTSGTARKQHLQEAGNLYKQIGRWQQAGNCLRDAGLLDCFRDARLLEEAANIFKCNCKPPMFETAAKTFVAVGQLPAVYNALDCCLEGRLWRYCLELLDKHESLLNTKNVAKYLKSCGWGLFKEQDYQLAEACFSRAGDEMNALLCKAEQQVVLSCSASGDSRKQHLQQAGNLYKQIGRWQQAGNCLRGAGLLEETADCYCKGGCWSDAAKTFEAMGQRYNALECCLKGRLWRYCFSLLEPHEAQPAEQDMKYLQSCAEGLFKMRNYKHAEMCFRRAGDKDNALLCKAEQHMVLSLSSSGDSRKQHLQEAGYLYKQIGRWQQAGNCLWEAGLLGDPPKLRAAAECYCKGRCWSNAAETFVAMGQLYTALECCLEGRLWRYCLSLLEQHETKLDQKDVVECLLNCGRGLFQEQDYQSAEACFSRAGNETNALLCKAEQQVVLSRSLSGDSRRQHLQEAGNLYKQIGRWQQAGNCLRDAGLFEEATTLLMKAKMQLDHAGSGS